MATNRYLVVSDMHLCDIEDNADGWKAHKSTPFVYDDEFDAMVAQFEGAAAAGDALTLILNGDIFDFDLVDAVPDDPPWPVNAIERKYGLAATDAKSSWRLQQILADHPVFVGTLARIIGGGGQVVMIYGNHDREFCFDGVRRVLTEAIQGHAEAAGIAFSTERLVYEPWFYYVRDEIYVEHGHQYDFYSAYRYNLEPTVQQSDERHLALPMGNLSNRYLLSNIGFFNPHATDFIMSAWGYVTHWLKHYAFTRRMLIWTWFIGSVRSLLALLATKNRLQRNPPADYERHLDAAATRYDVAPDIVRKLYHLREPPITNKLYKMVREFWIDRLVLALLLTGGTIALALTPVPLWVKLMVPLSAFPLVWFLYQWVAGTDNALTLEYELHTYAHTIATMLPARVVTFGHTHVPNIIPLGHESTFVNTGTWAPIWKGDRKTLAAGLRNYLDVAITGAECNVTLGSWMPLQPGSGEEGLADPEERIRR